MILFSNLQTDMESFDRFKLWRDNPTLSHDSEFIHSIMCEDIQPCLSFSNTQVKAANE